MASVGSAAGRAGYRTRPPQDRPPPAKTAAGKAAAGGDSGRRGGKAAAARGIMGRSDTSEEPSP